VGPNNSGKSLALREIENWCFGQDTQRSVVESMQVDFPVDRATGEALLRQFEALPPANQGTTPGHFWVGQHTFRADQPVRHFQVSIEELARNIEANNLAVLRSW